MSAFDKTLDDVILAATDHGVSVTRLVGLALAFALAGCFALVSSGSIFASVPSL